MSKFKTIIPVIICLLFCFSCDRKNKYNSLITKDEREYDGYVNYVASDWRGKYDSQYIMYKDISFDFDMDVPIDLSSIDSEFMILREGCIYRGLFKNHIEIKDLWFCMECDLTKSTPLAFVLIDHTNKQLYKWYKKETYSLYIKDNYYVKLKTDGEYIIDLDSIIYDVYKNKEPLGVLAILFLIVFIIIWICRRKLT